MSEQVIFSLGQAAKAAEVSKGTISKALASGRMSYRSKENGQYQIDAAELFRVFPKKQPEAVDIERLETPKETDETPVLRARLEAMEARLADKDNVIEDLRRRLDSEGEEQRRLTAILTDQSTKAAAATTAAAIAPRMDEEAEKGRRRCSGGGTARSSGGASVASGAYVSSGVSSPFLRPFRRPHPAD